MHGEPVIFSSQYKAPPTSGPFSWQAAVSKPERSGRYKDGLEGEVVEPDGLGEGLSVLVDHGDGLA